MDLSPEDHRKSEAAVAELRAYLLNHTVGEQTETVRVKLPGCTAVFTPEGKTTLALDQPVNFIDIKVTI